MKPLTLPPNQPPQFYRGGQAIAAFRGSGAAGTEFGPEDWVASTVTLFGTPSGLTTLPGGTLLRDAIAADPLGYLGSAHVDAFGANPALLVKLLDAGERLPVHVHPNRDFARRHLDCPFGKTEAWIVIGTTGDDAAVYVGFRDDIDVETLGGWVAAQEEAKILAALNKVAVSAGDTVLIPAGTPHAIGAGVFVIELQEPTDFSVMLEWKSFGLPERAASQLGLDPALALQCVDRTGWDADRLASAITRHAFAGDGTRSVFPSAADPFFRGEHVAVRDPVTWQPQFAVVVVADGTARLESSGRSFEPVDVRRGDTVLVPHGAGEVRVSGSARVVRCLPPVTPAA